jgi:hypothetical protein
VVPHATESDRDAPGGGNGEEAITSGEIRQTDPEPSAEDIPAKDVINPSGGDTESGGARPTDQPMEVETGGSSTITQANPVLPG